jgi:DNA-binding CsgD family transcriptional regulator
MKKSKNRELWYDFKPTGEQKYLVIKYAYLPPDIIVVHTDDITLEKLARIRNDARFELFENLRKSTSVDHCLSLCCHSINNSRLFRKTIACFLDNIGKLLNITHYGFDDDLINNIKSNHQIFRSENTRFPEKYRLSNSYFIPAEDSYQNKLLDMFPSFEQINSPIKNIWIDGDLLITLIKGEKGRIEGIIINDDPFESMRPDYEKVIAVEELVSAVMNRINELNNLQRIENDRQALYNSNIALKEIISTVEDDKNKFKKQFYDIIKDNILPLTSKLKTNGEAAGKHIHETLINFMNEIQSDSDDNRLLLSKLTPRELEICHLIKDGVTSSEISKRLYLSPATIRTFRESIRKKLNLTNSKINLSRFLREILD